MSSSGTTGSALRAPSSKARRLLVAVALSIAQTLAIAQGPTPEQEAAVRQIEAFSNGQAKSDPHYPAVEAELLGRIDEMVKTQPPAAWAATVRRWYFSLSERAHSEERARIRSVERAAAGGIVAPSPAAPDKLVVRLQALEKDLLGGKLSPREHALLLKRLGPSFRRTRISSPCVRSR